MKVKGQQPAEEVTGDSETFLRFGRRLMQVPHSEIKAEIEAEKAIKARSRSGVFRRMSDLSRVPAAPSKAR